MNRFVLGILVLALAFAMAWWLSVRQDAQELEQLAVTPSPQPELIRHPVENIRVPPLSSEAQPGPATSGAAETDPDSDFLSTGPVLPPLAGSDFEIVGALAEVVGADSIERFLLTEMLISRLVATIDSLSSQRSAPLMLPVRPVPGKFLVLGGGEQAAISPENAQRYAPLVELAVSVDTRRLVNIYRKYYPLFQQAYQELGYPQGYFNDRLVEVIDQLLETPQPEGMPDLRLNESVWEFADPRLESLPIGQKVLVRVGPAHAAVLKAKLRELRAAVTGMVR